MNNHKLTIQVHTILQEFYSYIINQAPVSLSELSLQGQRVKANPAATNMKGGYISWLLLVYSDNYVIQTLVSIMYYAEYRAKLLSFHLSGLWANVG